MLAARLRYGSRSRIRIPPRTRGWGRACVLASWLAAVVVNTATRVYNRAGHRGLLSTLKTNAAQVLRWVFGGIVCAQNTEFLERQASVLGAPPGGADAGGRSIAIAELYDDLGCGIAASSYAGTIRPDNLVNGNLFSHWKTAVSPDQAAGHQFRPLMEFADCPGICRSVS